MLSETAIKITENLNKYLMDQHFLAKLLRKPDTTKHSELNYRLDAKQRVVGFSTSVNRQRC